MCKSTVGRGLFKCNDITCWKKVWWFLFFIILNPNDTICISQHFYKYVNLFTCAIFVVLINFFICKICTDSKSAPGQEKVQINFCIYDVATSKRVLIVRYFAEDACQWMAIATFFLTYNSFTVFGAGAKAFSNFSINLKEFSIFIFKVIKYSCVVPISTQLFF